MELRLLPKSFVLQSQALRHYPMLNSLAFWKVRLSGMCPGASLTLHLGV